ncbi:MAG: hypothetical protein KGI27_12010 [Thaumarchaeota archaeon]|nr:hypothetical protein [Nitrososphaerota archaeon]
MVTIDKKDAIVAIIVLIATSYFTIFYNILQDLLKPFFNSDVALHGTTGLIAMAIGASVLVFFIKRQKKPI